jgi:UDPglucose--hexose-1-phosphate uridylyltransferase
LKLRFSIKNASVQPDEGHRGPTIRAGETREHRKPDYCEHVLRGRADVTGLSLASLTSDTQTKTMRTPTWEERWHPLREEWVIVAAHRQNRPWNGETVVHDEPQLPSYASDCYLCPGNYRISGARNDIYHDTFVFDNDHPCVGPEAPQQLAAQNGLYRNRPASGIARVVCYSPKHNVALAELEPREVENLLRVWQQQYLDLGGRKGIAHVLIFENRGEVVGVSNPHPHCQIYATNFIFKTIETEARASERHLATTGRVLFQDIIQAERENGSRIIYENEFALVFLPYFARYAYEAFVAPKKTHASITTLSDAEISDFAAALKCLLVKFDNLWRMPFPYVMTLHQAPTDGADYSAFHFHIEFHPPLRQPNLLKYLAGPEIGGGNFLSDTAPEEKAAELRAQPEIHYKQAEAEEPAARANL